MEPARFAITATPLGGTITVNGEDVTDLVGIAELRVADGQPTVLTLHHAAEGVIEGEGIVHIVDGPADDGEIICAFLDGIDPAQLDNDALNNADVSTNLTAALLETLKRYARGT